MAMSFFRRNWRRSIRMLLLPIFAAIILIQWIGDARSEAGMPVLNSSGNLNRELSVDPIGTKEGYSAYLYNTGNGLPTSEANDIAQDSIGIIWIGSYAGLIRYAGNSFERYDPDSGITSVRCLYTDSLDRLWIGSNDNGAFLLSKGEIHHWDKSSGFRSLSIRDIAEGEDGRIYIASTMGVGIIDASLAFTPLEDERISEQTVPQIHRGSDGLIYGLTQTGDLFALKNGKMSAFLKSADFPSEEPLEIFPDPEQPGYLYVGTEHYVCHGSLETGFDSREAREIAPLVSVECIESFGGRLWICARNGVGRLEDDGVHVIENIPMSNSLNHILSDFDGNLWITSSRHGVMKIVSNRFTDVFEQYGLPASVVNSTCMLDGRLFVGTENGLIVLEDGKKLNSLPVTEIVTASGKPVDVSDLVDYLDSIRVRTICRDSRNRLWISTARECGLLRYDHGKILQFTVEDGILDEAVRVVSECTDGSMLVATNNGVNVIEGDRVVQGYGQEDGMDVRMILTVTEGFSNEVIAGSDGGGIYIIRPEGIRKIGIEDGLTSEIIMRIKRSRIRDLYWIITGNSLACMTPDYQVKTVRAFPTANNIDLYENSRGDLWLLGTHEINVILSEDIMADEPGEPIYLETADGLPYVVTSNSYSEVTENGDLFMSGNEGVVKVNIDQSLSYNGEIRISMPYRSGRQSDFSGSGRQLLCSGLRAEADDLPLCAELFPVQSLGGVPSGRI